MRLMRQRGGGAAEHDEPADDETCYICANSFCAPEECSRTQTHLACCTQAICCGCLLKSSKRCGCKEDCDAVISLCPFCREVSPVEALDVFLGSRPTCKRCKDSDEPASGGGSPQPSPAATAPESGESSPAPPAPPRRGLDRVDDSDEDDTPHILRLD